jgi:hypothetical protein
MAFVSIETNLNTVQKNIERWPRDARKAAAITLNKVVRKGNKAAKTHIKKNFNFKKVGSITRRVSIKRADARGGDSIVATIFIKKVGRGLGLYSAGQRGSKGKRKGRVSVRVKGTRKTLRQGAFISTWSGEIVDGNSFMKGSTVFRKATGSKAGTITRISRSGRPYKADKREMLFGPDVAQLYGSRKVRVLINKTVVENYQPVFDADFKKRLDKRKK